jgi:hypothetical protein
LFWRQTIIDVVKIFRKKRSHFSLKIIRPYHWSEITQPRRG